MRSAKANRNPSRRYHVVGLTGGVGSGKSTVLKLFEEKGAFPLDADAIVKKLLTEPRIKRSIRRSFGERFITRDGSIDKAALAKTIFSHLSQRRRLERILHPKVRKEMERSVRRRGRRIAVCDIPLLFESKKHWKDKFDAVVVVNASRTVREERLRRKGWAPSDIRRRIAAQIPLSRKVQDADFVIDNNATISRTRKQVGELWKIFSKQ